MLYVSTISELVWLHMCVDRGDGTGVFGSPGSIYDSYIVSKRKVRDRNYMYNCSEISVKPLLESLVLDSVLLWGRQEWLSIKTREQAAVCPCPCQALARSSMSIIVIDFLNSLASDGMLAPP